MENCFNKIRDRNADDKCFNAEDKDLRLMFKIPFYPLKNPEQFIKNHKLKENNISWEDFPLIKDLIMPPKNWQDNIPGTMCKKCVVNVVLEFLQKRKCFNLKTVINVLTNMTQLSDNKNPKNTAIGNAVYLGKQFADLNQEQRKELRVSEEHIVPASIVAHYFRYESEKSKKKIYDFFYFDGTVKSLTRELHPILTDLHNIYMTTGNINNTRSNFMLGEINPENITGAIRFDIENPSKCNDGPAEILQNESQLDYNKRYEGHGRGDSSKRAISPRPPRQLAGRIPISDLYSTGSCKPTGRIAYKPKLGESQPRKCDNENNQLEAVTSEKWNLVNEAFSTIVKYIKEEKNPHKQQELYYQVSRYFNPKDIPDAGFYNMCLSNFCQFEPLDQDKGKIARTIIYFYVIYGIAYKDRLVPGIAKAYFNTNMETFKKWAKHPITESENLRNMRVAAFQGHPNPFISYRTKDSGIIRGVESNLVEKIFDPKHVGEHYNSYLE